VHDEDEEEHSCCLVLGSMMHEEHKKPLIMCLRRMRMKGALLPRGAMMHEA